MKLYDYSGAPSPRRVRVFLAEKGIEVPTTQVDIARGEQFQEPFCNVNPGGVVPVLELDDGTLLCESMAICRYFEAVQPDPPLMGVTPREQGIVEMWTRRVEFTGYLAVADCLRNSHPRFEGRGLPGLARGVEQIPPLVERGRATLDRCIAQLDAQLADHRFVAGETYTVADITALVCIDFARVIKVGIPEQCEHLARWHAEVSTRPSASA